MSYGASDEVAEDFKVALEDLTMNSRYEISNLTIIAKENTENALAISEALKDHIKRVGEAFSYCREFTRELLATQGGVFSIILLCFDACLGSFTYVDLDRPSEETPRTLPPRFDCQECRHTLYTVLRSTTLLNIHGGVCPGRQQCPPEDGGDAQDMEGAGAWVDRYTSCVPPGSDQTD
jgi:pre-mRNA cleavage complex 2 protein Pcf11